MKKNLSGKNILITAGPTWTAIDEVRVISNIATGKTGMAIAEYACKIGAKVTILLGPGQAGLDKTFAKKIRILNFKFFDELYDLVKKEVSGKKYDIFIHSAAVSDYQPAKAIRGKIKSNRKELTINLKPAIKIVDQIKKFDPKIFLVKFKLEVSENNSKLIDIAYKSMIHSKADLIVANSQDTIKGKTFVINPEKQIIEIAKRRELPKYLLETISSSF